MTQFKYNIKREFLDRESIREEQAVLLAGHIEYCRKNSPYYASILKEFPPATHENSFELLSKMPYTHKDDLAKNITLFAAAPESDIRDISFSSGTTGVPLPIIYTEKDLQRLAYNEQKAFMSCGMTQNDRILLTCTLDRCFIAGLAYREGIRAVGASVIRNGLNSLESHAGVIEITKPTILIGVPSFLKKLANYMSDKKIDTASVKKLICIGEAVRDKNGQLAGVGILLKKLWGADIYSTYASTETITSFCDCKFGCGGHLHHDLALLEVVDETGKQCEKGEPGEVVITPLQIEGIPLLRFKTGDISVIFEEKCKCGRSTPRLGPILGRKQHLMKINGTTLYPETIFTCLDSIEEIINYYIVAKSRNGCLTHAEVTLSSRKNSALTAKSFSSKIAAAARVSIPVKIDSFEHVNQKIFNGSSRKPTRFFIDESEETKPKGL